MGAATQNGGITQTFPISHYLYKKNMKKTFVPQTNSIYQQRGSAPGLTVSGGMLINNTSPYQTTTISQAVQASKMRKRMEKVAIMSEAVALGNAMSKF